MGAVGWEKLTDLEGLAGTGELTGGADTLACLSGDWRRNKCT